MAEIRLTTGGIGTGKSYKNVKDAYEELQKGENCKYERIYSNIRGHAELCEGVLPLPDDWRECEPHSLIIIDECQAHEKFSKHFSNRRDSEIVDLTMIRHHHLDMWLISPNPTLVNKDVRDLVNVHVCLEANGKETTKAFCFDKVQINLTKSVKQRAFDEFTYAIEPKYCAMYKSTEDGTPSRRTYNVNFKLISFVVGLIFVTLVIVGLVTWLMKGTKTDIDELSKTETKNKESSSVNADPISSAFSSDKPVSDDECRKGINVERPECIAYFDRLTSTNSSVTSQGMTTQSVQYDPSNPYDTESIQQSVSYQVTAKPVFSGCAKMNGRYQAYTQQGTKINVSEADCKKLINENDRPFNYFASNQQQTMQAPVVTERVSTSEQQQLNSETSSL